MATLAIIGRFSGTVEQLNAEVGKTCSALQFPVTRLMTNDEDGIGKVVKTLGIKRRWPTQIVTTRSRCKAASQKRDAYVAQNANAVLCFFDDGESQYLLSKAKSLGLTVRVVNDVGTPRVPKPGTPRKFAIVGSRDYAFPERVKAKVREIYSENPKNIIVSGHGGIVDLTAEAEAKRLGMATMIFPADWSKGKSAGFNRNTLIAKAADLGVAFWDGKSNGTRDTIAKMRNLGKPMSVLA